MSDIPNSKAGTAQFGARFTKEGPAWNHGIRRLVNRAVSPLKPAWTALNEVLLHIHTVPGAFGRRAQYAGKDWWRGPSTELARHDDNFQYATIDYWNIRKMIRVLNPGPNDVVYDIGAGMGRVICMLARRRLRKCVGIELLEPLCRVAQQNAASLRGRKTPIDIICADATTADLADGTIYFFFNPFGAETMRDTMENIKNSLAHNPRSIRIIYYNPVHEDVLEGLDWLERERQYASFGGKQVTFWVSRASADRDSSGRPSAP